MQEKKLIAIMSARKRNANKMHFKSTRLVFLKLSYTVSYKNTIHNNNYYYKKT